MHRRVCLHCLNSYLEDHVKEGNADLCCMVTKNCKGHYTESFIQKALKDKKEVRDRLDVLTARQIITTKSLSGIVDCPFCNFFCIMDGEENELHCKNPSCQKVSCRKCRLESHPSRSCGNVESEINVEYRKFLEKRMSEAMIRYCNACHMPVIKDKGCNFVKCSCGAGLCYVCRMPMTAADEKAHFFLEDRKNKCEMFENSGQADEERVRTAKKEAIKEWCSLHPDFDIGDTEDEDEGTGKHLGSMMSGWGSNLLNRVYPLWAWKFNPFYKKKQ